MTTQNSLRPARRDSNQPTAALSLSADLTQYFANDHHAVISAQKLEAVNTDLLAALEAIEAAATHSLVELNQGTGGLVSATHQARAAIARATQP